jgi:copper(I)-binding protein
MSATNRTRGAVTRAAAIALLVLLLGACSPAASPSITVSGAWARPSQAMAGAGAAYLTIENGGTSADVLIGAASPAAATVEIHETVVMEPEASGAMPSSDGGAMASPEASGGMDAGGGMMGMQKVDRLEIPAGGSVELKPGGYHVMLIDLTGELRSGDQIEITLTFEQAGEVKVVADVREG